MLVSTVEDTSVVVVYLRWRSFRRERSFLIYVMCGETSILTSLHHEIEEVEEVFMTM